MPLNPQAAQDALLALSRALNTIQDYPLGADAPLSGLQETLRAGVIQQFEVAYEQCWKLLQRWIRENIDPEQADHPRTRKDLFRLAAQHQLIDDPMPWFTFGDARNLTSHTYDEATAQHVFAIAHDFLPHAQILLVRLHHANN
jgi:nucleotidyltransferase substrate binding protein (TIGR01987 family)